MRHPFITDETEGEDITHQRRRYGRRINQEKKTVTKHSKRTSIAMEIISKKDPIFLTEDSSKTHGEKSWDLKQDQPWKQNQVDEARPAME
jgi:hypothetical protein